MQYKHKIIIGLAQLVSEYGGKSSDPLMRAIWMGVKGQVPNILKQLDDNDEAIKMMEEKIKAALEIKEAPDLTEELRPLLWRRNKDGSVMLRVPADHRLAVLFAEPVVEAIAPVEAAEVEITVEPAEE